MSSQRKSDFLINNVSWCKQDKIMEREFQIFIMIYESTSCKFEVHYMNYFQYLVSGSFVDNFTMLSPSNYSESKGTFRMCSSSKWVILKTDRVNCGLYHPPPSSGPHQEGRLRLFAGRKVLRQGDTHSPNSMVLL